MLTLRVAVAPSSTGSRLLLYCLAWVLTLTLALELYSRISMVSKQHAPPAPKSTRELRFAPDLSEPVSLRIDSSAHYQLDDEDSAEEFEKLLPHGGHLVHLSSPEYPSAPPQPYTVMLFHQLKCLGVMREEYAAARNEPSALTQHCINYLRQTILCRPNLLAESAWNSEGTAVRGYDTVCHDWTKVYEEAERNQEGFSTYWDCQ